MPSYDYQLYRCEKGTAKGRIVGHASTEESAKVQKLRLESLYVQYDFIIRRAEIKPKTAKRYAFIGLPDYLRNP